MFQETIKAYNEWLKFGCYFAKEACNKKDVLIAGYCNSEIQQCRYDLGRNFSLDDDERVFWVRDTSVWNDRNQGCVITDWGIRIINDNDHPEDIISIGWNDVSRAEYRDQYIYYYFYDGDFDRIDLDSLFKSVPDYSYYGNNVSNLFNYLAMSQSFNTSKEIDNSISNLFEQENYYEVLLKCNELLSESNISTDDLYSGLRYRGMANKNLALRSKSEYSGQYLSNAISDFQQGIKLGWNHPDVYNEMAFCAMKMPDNFPDVIRFRYMAYRWAVASLDIDNINEQASRNAMVCDIYDHIFGNRKYVDGIDIEQRYKFTNPNNEFIPFADRQFIMFAKRDDQMAGYYDPDENIKWVFALNKYPNDIKIEGVPQANVLYMANPIKSDTYLPYEYAEDILFQNKIREFEYLVGCLGATEIRFRSLKGKKISSEREFSKNVNGGFDAKFVSANVNANWGSNESFRNDYSSERGRIQRFNPTKYPFIPDGLGWYNYVEEWRDFARQRLQNGLTHYHYIFKSSESSSLSTQKKLDISASFKKMVVSINAHYSQNIKENIEIQEETEWEVEVDFKPLEEFANQSDNAKKSGFVEIPVSNVTLNDNEQFYYDELQDVLADGVITENDRKRLERRRQRLNISEERAKEIEQMLSPSLTDDEQEYYDELFEVLDDGVIDDKERRSLDRLKRSLGISDSRAKEIEDMAFAKRGLK